MRLTPQQYDELVLVLENDSSFYATYMRHRGSSFGRRREVISTALWSSPDYTRWRIVDIEDRDQLRRYFDDRYDIPQTELNKYAHIPSVWRSVPSEAALAPTSTPTPTFIQEPIMAKTPIEITTKTFVNGTDVKDMTDAQVYDLIAQQEAAIKELEKIEAKPKKLVAELARRREGITALVEYLDSKE